MEIGSEVEVGQRLKGRGYFYPHFLQKLPSLKRLTDLNEFYTKSFRTVCGRASQSLI